MKSKKIFLFCLSLIYFIIGAIPVFATDHISITANPSGGISIGATGASVASNADGYSLILDKYKMVGQGIMGLCVLVSLVFFILYITKLSAAGSNPMAKRNAVKGILFSGIALAIFGGLPFVISFCLSFLR